jgi:hypothetical protein
MPEHPLAEVFGHPTNDFSQHAVRCRKNKLYPFNNKIPNCTKDKAKDPLGVCSINHFIKILQSKVDEKLDSPPANQTLDSPFSP